jgi:hypothetical protein
MTTTAVKLADGTDSGRDRDRIISERGPAGYDSRTNGSALRQSRSMRMRLHRSFYYCFFFSFYGLVAVPNLLLFSSATDNVRS